MQFINTRALHAVVVRPLYNRVYLSPQQAVQLTFEDYFMSDLDIAPLKIVGYEGVFGVAFMAALLLPAVRLLPGAEGDGIHEDTLDTFAMIRHSGTLQVCRRSNTYI